MKKIALTILLITTGLQVFSQTTIKGKVTDSDGQPLPGANIIIKGSYEGASTDGNGQYSFTTMITEKQLLLVSFVGFSVQEKEVNLTKGEIVVDFSLIEQNSQIGDVVITAGTFEASDKKKSVTMQPLDIVTTPSAAGDIYGALSSLPGTTMVGEDGRLFVRGGDGYESKTFIDGLLVKKPYSSTMPDIPSRGRFSPFLFSGTMFSTGGYSAEYGQALSSALILATNAFPERSQTDLSILTVGMEATRTFKSKNASASLGFGYSNLLPYFSIIKQHIDWEKYPQTFDGTFVGRYRLKNNGILKVFSSYQSGSSAFIYPDMTEPGKIQKISLSDQNNYTNINYFGSVGDGWTLKSGLSFTYDEEKKSFRIFDVNDNDNNLQGKITLKKKFTESLSLLFGGEEVINHFNEKYMEKDTVFTFRCSFNDFNTTLFAETEINPLPGLAVRAGIRGEYSSVIDKPALAFRSSAAFAVSKKIQVSFAYGSFYQTPEETLLRFTHNLNFEKAEHFIGNIQYEANDRIFRIEGYFKRYSDLVLYNEDHFSLPSSYNNNGNGYSKGLDIFFRDRKSIENLDYWISYSFLVAERYYRSYPEKATPSFAAKHSFNLVAKKFFTSLNTQFGASLTWASGRPYNNPNSSLFMGDHTRNYMDMSLNISYLTRIFNNFTIVYTSLSNVFGRDNIYGYRYYETPNQEGIYESIPVRSEAKRFFLIGVFITI